MLIPYKKICRLTNLGGVYSIMIILTYKKLSLLYRRLMSYLCYMLRNIKGNTYEVPVMDTETLQNLLEFRSVVGETYSFFFFFFFLTIIDSVKVLIVFL